LPGVGLSHASVAAAMAAAPVLVRSRRSCTRTPDLLHAARCL
jgi:hypothetical protein